MRSALYRATVRCRLRRLAGASRTAPLPAFAALVIVVAAPFGLWRAGAAVGGSLAGAIGSGGVANALVLGPVLAASLAGVVIAVSLPGRAALGMQLAAGPCGRCDAVLAGLVAPIALFSIVVLPSLVAACVALAIHLPGGAPAGVGLVAAIVAAVPAGGIVAEGAFGLVRRDARTTGIAAGLVTSWLLAGTAAGEATLWPLAPVALSLEGSSAAWGALMGAAVVAGGLSAAWIELVARRPPPRSRRSRRTRAIVRGRAGWAVTAAGTALLARRTDVRIASIASLGFGIVGIAVAAAASSTGSSPFLLATTTALFGSVVPSLVIGGALVNGRWLWVRRRSGPVGVASLAGLVAIAGSSAPVVLVGLAAAGTTGVTLAAAGFAAASVVFGASAGLVAGALVPWRGAGIGDQLTTFAAFGGVAIAVSLGLGVVGPKLAGLGVPAPLVVGAAGGASVVVAVTATGWRLRSEKR